VAIGFSDVPVLRNNLGLSSTTYNIDGSVSSVDSDYNLLAPVGSSLVEGSRSMMLSSTTGIVVNASVGDFHLVSASPASDKALSLSTLGKLAPATTAFSADIANVVPQGTAWDIL
jgi:hypothetical protein